MTPVRVILFTGKGGVGKTTAAAATAVRLADRGTKTLLVSTDGAHSVADALGCALSDEPAQVEPGLWAVQLSTQARFESSWRQVQEWLLRVLAHSGADPVVAEELAVLPGVEEVIALLAVRDLAERGDWDAVVVDCAPTAETVRLLALPEALSWYLDRALPAHRTLARGLRPFGALFAGAEAIPSDGVFAAVLRLRRQLAEVRSLLADPQRTSVRLVLTPEAVVVAEAKRTHTALSLYGYRVDAVVANRIFPAGRDAWRSGWVAAQAAQLAELPEHFGGLPVHRLSYRPAEPVGTEALRAVAGELYGALPGRDPAVRSDAAPTLWVEQDQARYLLHLALPLVGDEPVDAVRAGDELVVTLGDRRRVLALPSVLRRCAVTDGQVTDGELIVGFEPDPALWPDRVTPPNGPAS